MLWRESLEKEPRRPAGSFERGRNLSRCSSCEFQATRYRHLTRIFVWCPRDGKGVRMFVMVWFWREANHLYNHVSDNLISCCMCRPHTLTPVVMQCLFVIGFLSLLKERLIHIRSCKYTTQTNPILIFVTFHLWTLATWYSRRISIRAMISLRGHGPAAVWWLRTPVKKTLVV